MTEAVFAAEPTRLLIAAAVGIILLLWLIIKIKIHPVLSLLISALVIGLGAGMPVPTLVSTVEKGAGETLQGIVIAVGVPVGILSLLFAGILWSKFIGSKINVGLPVNVSEVREADEANLPKFSTVLGIILVPLVLILLNTVSAYIPGIDALRPVLEFLGTPFVALVIAVLFAMYFLGKKQGYDGEQLKKILDRSLRPTGQILLVITGGGIIRWVLQDCGMGDIIGPALEKSGLPLVIVAFLIAALIRASVGAAVVAMTMAAGIMAAMPGVAELSPVYLAAMVCAINGGATAFSHVNDSGFWLVGSLLEIDEKTTLKSWTMMESIIGFTGLICAIVLSLFA